MATLLRSLARPLLVWAMLATVLAVGAPVAAAQNTPMCDGKPATIVGTEAKDRLVGGPGNDVIVGLGGPDVIIGGGGRDTICGGDGSDKIYGGRNADVIFGEQGNDRILGEAGSDTLSGGPGRDIVVGGGGIDIITGNGGGDRRLVGGAGADQLNGGSGEDRCEVAAEDTARNRCELDLSGAATGGNGGGANVPPELVVLDGFIRDTLIADYGAQNPWIEVSWDYILEEEVTIEPGLLGGFVLSTCRTTLEALPDCKATEMTIGEPVQTNVDIVLHELAHVYDQTPAINANRSSMAIAALYLEATYPDATCPSAELLADAVVADIYTQAQSGYWRFRCGNTVPPQPTAADLAVIRAALDGQDHPWFLQNHTTGEDGWTAIFDSEHKSKMAASLDDQYGGYCSTAHMNRVLFQIVSDPNPFADGGC